MDKLAHVDADVIHLALDEDHLPEPVAEDGPLASHTGDEHVESDSGPAISAQEHFQESKANKGHDVDVLPHGEDCLHGVARESVLSVEVFLVLGV